MAVSYDAAIQANHLFQLFCLCSSNIALSVQTLKRGIK